VHCDTGGSEDPLDVIMNVVGVGDWNSVSRRYFCTRLYGISCQREQWWGSEILHVCGFTELAESSKTSILSWKCVTFVNIVQGDSLARGPKLLPIKHYVIEIMTWKFIYTYRERCKTGPSRNRCWKWPPFISKYTWRLIDNSLGPLARESPCIICGRVCPCPS
jgi:hypothetical protein